MKLLEQYIINDIFSLVSKYYYNLKFLSAKSAE